MTATYIYTMPAGLYYIGDLCYVMDYTEDNYDEWDEFCAMTTEGNNCLNGHFTMKDGRTFVSFSTRYGDGEYPCSHSSNLRVDAGLIGCISLNNLKTVRTIGELNTLGTVQDFKEPFECTCDEQGVMQFGHITVDTSCTEEECYD